MGQTARTTKLLLNLRTREQGGANSHKRRYLEETVAILDAGRRFYLDFFLAHPEKLMERKDVIGKARGYLTTLTTWQVMGKKKGKPGVPTAANHPTLYAGTFHSFFANQNNYGEENCRKQA